MASKICSLHIVNKKGKTRAIARSVVGPNSESLVHFYTLDQVIYAQKLEEEQEIEIKTEIPSYIQDQIDAKQRVEETFPMSAVSQVREQFDGVNVHQKTQEGWNSPNQAYKGEDLSDRPSGFASTSSAATQEGTETPKETPTGEEASTTEEDNQTVNSQWNSPDDAYKGEDLSDREYDNESVENAVEAKSTEARKFEERKAVGPQDQSGDTPSEQKEAPSIAEKNETNASEVEGDAADAKREEAKEDAEKSEALSEQADAENEKIAAEKGGDVEASSDEDEKPEWYLSYQEVEGKTRQELIDWSETVPDEENFKLAKNKSAADTKEDVHNFLSNKFSDHAE